MNNQLYDELLKRGLDHNEINQFLKAYEHGIYLPRSLKNVDVMRKMREVCAVHDYKFSVPQQEIILNAILKGVDASKVANPEYNITVMNQIFCGLVEGYDITKYKDFDKGYDTAGEVRLAMKHGLDDEKIKCLIELGRSSHADLCEIRYCLEDGVPVKEIKAHKDAYSSELRELRKRYKEI